MKLHNIIYNKWVIGWGNLEVIDRIIINHYNLESKLEELKNIVNSQSILPIGRHMSLFPPPYISEEDKVIVIELSNLNHINILNNIADIDAGASYRDISEYCFKNNLFLPVSPSISTFESIGGMYSTGLISSWYNIPLNTILLKKDIFPQNGGKVYNTFGRNNLILNLSIRCFPLEADSPIYIKFSVSSVERIPEVIQKFSLKYKLFPRTLVAYANNKVTDIFINLPHKTHKDFMKSIAEEPYIYDISPIYTYSSIYPVLPEETGFAAIETAYLYLLNMSENDNQIFFNKYLPKKKCIVIFIDFLKRIIVVICLKKLENYLRKVVIEDGVIKEVDYKDV